MATVRGADLETAARSIDALLRALGIDPARDPELTDTPARVARMYADEFLDGYSRDPVEVLRDGVLASDPGLVVVSSLRYVSMCPHHMLPSAGRAHIGYLPAGRIVGLGTLSRLLDTFAHRLVLQETLGQNIVDALVNHLGARGAGVMLRARHQCLRLRGERQGAAAVTTVALAGSMRAGVDRESFLRALPATSIPRARRRAK